MRRTVIAGLAAVPLGVLLGVAGQEAEEVARPLRWVFALGVPWLAVCWAAGAFAGRTPAGAVAGAVALTTATGAYYVLHVWHGHWRLGLAAVVVGWGAASVAAGALYGAAGGAWRTGRAPVRVAAVVLLAGTMAGEAILLAGEWPQQVTPLLELELLAAAVAPFLLVRPWRVLPVALALTAAAALLLGAAEHEVRETMRLAGWTGL
ncbi:MAG TPA: DUF6518 family protein [Solirubrobacteraceae bacterium]|jgi:hypothetical protein|nr:DUF6518 family protein [Solirubrobacteraceae bacterium]